MTKALHIRTAVFGVLACALAFIAPPAKSQTILSQTTLSSAVTSTSQTTVQVGSTTCNGCPSSVITAGGTVIYVADTASSGEMMFVNGVSSSGGYLNVTRGYSTSGKARTHASGALVFVGVPFAFGTQAPSGSCTRSQILYLPDIAVGLEGVGTIISDCVGGVWVQGSGVNPFGTFAALYQPDPGAVIYTSINSTGTALTGGTGAGASTQYCTEMDVKGSKNATGLAALLGSVGGTDKHIVALYDATGNLIANSALAGTTAGTASTYEQIAFTSKYYLVGPAKYYACLQSNGTTATVRMLVTSTLDAYTTKGIASQTFGTLPATITVPTTFTTAVGPYWQVY